mmetsp:Transcript_10343/g.18819  ORF Transcript_10343/g.18819 Transcript_10343/m.18819 type:complete len:204 (-) Transcript_10343:274-885(-)
MLEFPFESTECFVETKSFGYQQVSSFSFKRVVFLFLHNEIDISRLHVWLFVCHSTKDNLLTVSHTLFNQDVQHLAFLFSLSFPSFTTTITTLALKLLHHSQSNLAKLQHDSLSITRCTHGGFSYQHLTIDRQFDSLSIIQVFQRHLERMIDILPSRRTTTPSRSTEKHAKQVVVRMTTATTTVVVTNSIQTKLVISSPLLGIA